MKISRLGHLLIVLLFTGLLGWGASIDIPLVAQGSEVQEIAAALDANGNQVLDDAEIRQAVQLWIGGGTVPGTTQTISDATILKLIQLWVTGEKITAGPPKSTQITIADIYRLDLTAEGHIAHGASISSAPAGSLITISGTAFPTNAMVQIDGIETSILDHSAQMLITFVPNVGTESKTVEIVISDRNNSAVKGSKSFTVEPLNTQSIADPTKTITDFVKAARTALATATGNSDALALLNKLETALPVMSDGEKRSIAAGIENSNVLLLAGKVQGTQGTAAASSNQQAVPVPADHLNTIEPSRADLFGNVLDQTKRLNLPPLVDFNLTPIVLGGAEDSLSAVEGDQRNLRCYADVNGGISTIAIAMQAGSEANFVDENGTPIAGLMVDHVYNSTGAETLVADWNSKVTGQARVVTFTCTAKDNLVFQQSQSKTVTLAVNLTVRGDEPLPPTQVDCNIAGEGTFLSKWGSEGSGDGQFNNPTSLVVDAAGNVYVVDAGNNRVQKFDANGTFLTKWNGLDPNGSAFNYPYGVALDVAGNVYVTDSGNHRIERSDANGNNPVWIGTLGMGDSQFSNPHGVALDSAGNLYIVDTDNNRVQKFDINGDYATQWGSFGNSSGEFDGPTGIAVDSSDRVFVVDTGNDRVQKFTSSGTFLAQAARRESRGKGKGDDDDDDESSIDLDFAEGVAPGARSDEVYIADTGNNRIQRYDFDREKVREMWGYTGSGDGEFKEPRGVGVDSGGHVYVADSGNHRIQKFCGR